MMSPSWQSGIPGAPAIRVMPPNPLYVDTVIGSDKGEGTLTKPLLSLDAARLMCAGLPDWVIKIHAPEATPLRQEMVYESTASLTIEGIAANDQWYVYGSEIVSGWTHVANGVYSRTMVDWTLILFAVVTTMSEQIGDKTFQRKLLASDTPTTPGEGEFGYTGGVMYVKLVGGVDPNLHVIEVAKRNTGLGTRGHGLLKIRNMYGRYFLSAGIKNGLAFNPLGTGNLTVEDCTIEYSAGSGVAAAGQTELTTCIRTKAYRCANDGFNLHGLSGASVMVLNDCDGSYNGDKAGQSAQGASNHEATWLIINGGRYDYNVSGGMVVINTARCDIHGDTGWGSVVMRYNMRYGNTAGVISNQGGCAWMDESVGTVTGSVSVLDGGGVGVRRWPTATVVGLSNITSMGNAFPDAI
ncbi:hypothetical protein D3C81_417200 [compost metagenome]